VFAGSANPHEAVIGLHIPLGFTADQQLIHPTFLAAHGQHSKSTQVLAAAP
jgi:hypothetical protein